MNEHILKYTHTGTAQVSLHFRAGDTSPYGNYADEFSTREVTHHLNAVVYMHGMVWEAVAKMAIGNKIFGLQALLYLPAHRHTR